MPHSILVIDDKEKLCRILCKNFEENGFRSHFANDTSSALRILNSVAIHIVLLDIRLGEENGVETLRKILKSKPSLPVIMITAFGTVETAVTCLKLGAIDYIQKPIDFESLLNLVNRTIRLSRSLRGQGSGNRTDQERGNTIVTRSRKMQCILDNARRLAVTDLPVLILGESGTGKELLADYIHENSLRATTRITRINCSAFPESLLENELFGHEKGAFTNAEDTFQGVFEQADRGTLFLDEIGDMAPATQAKILRAIQNGEIRRLGGKHNIHVNVRILTATNRNLEDMIREGSFRSDLLYRLNTATITLPPLRERKEDITLISDHILENHAAPGGRAVSAIAGEVMDIFIEYDWPGNIRELRNTILYAAAVATTDKITSADLPARFSGPNPGIAVFEGLEEHERKLIQHTLAKTGYNKKQTAELLNMSRRSLYNKLEKYSIEL